MAKPQKHKRAVALNVESSAPVSLKQLRELLASLVGQSGITKVTVVPLDTDK